MPNYGYVQSSGVIVPDTATLQAEVEAEYRVAFGADLITTPDTPQGVLITAEVQARDGLVRNNADLANQINPNLAGGVFLDAICALTGLDRTAATRSTVAAQLTGVAGTVIPEGTRASTTDGNLFETVSEVTLDLSGNASANFQSVDTGPIPCGVGDLDQIVDAVLGWETVTNAAAAVLGTTQQTDQNLRAQRRNTLALQGISVSEAVTSGLYATEGVKSLTYRENIAAITQVIDGVSMVAHSVYVCVDGGTDSDVAATLLNNKTVGAAWNGAVTVNVTDQYSGQLYAVKFDRPEEIQIDIEVTVKPLNSLTDPVQTVKDAIMAYVNGELSDEGGFTVGTAVSPFELAGAINRLSPPLFVKLVRISDDSGMTWQSTELLIDIDQVARTNQGQISVIVT